MTRRGSEGSKISKMGHVICEQPLNVVLISWTSTSARSFDISLNHCILKVVIFIFENNLEFIHTFEFMITRFTPIMSTDEKKINSRNGNLLVQTFDRKTRVMFPRQSSRIVPTFQIPIISWTFFNPKIFSSKFYLTILSQVC